jgi:hypothetical protein
MARVQKYDPDELFDLVDTYESLQDAQRDVPGSSTMGIRTAIKACKVYKGFRWIFADPALDPLESQPVPDTVDGRTPYKGRIAEMTADKTRIVRVHANKKAAAEALGVTFGTVRDAVKCGYNTVAGTKLVHYDGDDLSEDIKAAYTGFLPDIVSHMTHALAVGVRRIDEADGSVVDYVSLSAAVSANPGVTVKPLKRAVAKGVVYQGATWKHTGTV